MAAGWQPFFILLGFFLHPLLYLHTMLKKLTIQNYALIDQLEMQLGKGMNIITGETGAGKSVLMGALGLLLGERSDSSALLDKTKKCVLEGEFSISSKVKSFLTKAELDAEDELIIHREITKEGKSRAFINDTPVNLSLLKELGSMLVDIHSQHETLLLNQSGFQMSVVDAFAGNGKLLDDFRLLFSRYRSLKQQLSDVKENQKKLLADQDYLLFQYTELEEANLHPGEQFKLEEELSSLSHAGEINAAISNVSEVISKSDQSILSSLINASNRLSGVVKYSPDIAGPIERLRAVQIELKDIDYELLQLTDKIISDPHRIELLNDRLSLIYKLQQKHRLESIELLIELRDNIHQKLLSFASMDEIIQHKTKELELIFSQVKKSAAGISEKRNKVAPTIEIRLKKMLGEVGMPEAILKIDLSILSEDEINENGMDSVRFLFSANKGIPLSDMNRVASGGELSRMMLCLKASVAKLIQLPTIVFDEIDTGVSGEIAFKIGKVMQELSNAHQLVSITHLPQIASRGEDHFFVFKELTGKKTYTKVKKLSYDERVVEVARMLSGDKPTAVAIENAKELLNN